VNERASSGMDGWASCIAGGSRIAFVGMKKISGSQYCMVV
jgi:hypothetical protein